jgi:hypothetical protein
VPPPGCPWDCHQLIIRFSQFSPDSMSSIMMGTGMSDRPIERLEAWMVGECSAPSKGEFNEEARRRDCQKNGILE